MIVKDSRRADLGASGDVGEIGAASLRVPPALPRGQHPGHMPDHQELPAQAIASRLRIGAIDSNVCALRE
jgi:hypothetical protein